MIENINTLLETHKVNNQSLKPPRANEDGVGSYYVDKLNVESLLHDRRKRDYG